MEALKHLGICTLLLVLWTVVMTADANAEENRMTLPISSVVRIYDGDTFFITIPSLNPVFGDELGVRIAGIDTPELRSRCSTDSGKAIEKELAIRARNVVDQLFLSDGNRFVILENLERGKYFRLVADVWIDDVNIKKVLIDSGLAVDYDGGKKTKDWCK